MTGPWSDAQLETAKARGRAMLETEARAQLRRAKASIATFRHTDLSVRQAASD
jgi:hypothetical protein